MKMLKLFGIVLIFGITMTFGSELGEHLSIPGSQHLVIKAEARIGRPLTPVSVAGVARRTVRRCAIGVYNCSLPGSLSTESLYGEINPELIGIENHQASFPLSS